MNWLNPAWVGRVVLAELAVIGMAARLLLRLVALIPAALRRFSLVVEQTFFVEVCETFDRRLKSHVQAGSYEVFELRAARGNLPFKL